MNRITLSYRVALTGFFGLFFSLILWYGWLNTTPAIPRSIALLLTLGPLMFPLRGLLHGRPYTFGWTTFLALFYFVLGVLFLADAETRLAGILVTVFSVMLFTGAMFFARWKGQKENQASKKPG